MSLRFHCENSNKVPLFQVEIMPDCVALSCEIPRTYPTAPKFFTVRLDLHESGQVQIYERDGARVDFGLEWLALNKDLLDFKIPDFVHKLKPEFEKDIIAMQKLSKNEPCRGTLAVFIVGAFLKAFFDAFGDPTGVNHWLHNLAINLRTTIFMFSQVLVQGEKSCQSQLNMRLYALTKVLDRVLKAQWFN